MSVLNDIIVKFIGVATETRKIKYLTQGRCLKVQNTHNSDFLNFISSINCHYFAIKCPVTFTAPLSQFAAELINAVNGMRMFTGSFQLDVFFPLLLARTGANIAVTVTSPKSPPSTTRVVLLFFLQF